MTQVEVTFEMQSDKSYSCIVDYEFPKFGLIGYGSTAREAEEDIFTSHRETRELLGDAEVPDIEITFRKFDVGSFFSYYPFFNVTPPADGTEEGAAQRRHPSTDRDIIFRQPCFPHRLTIMIYVIKKFERFEPPVRDASAAFFKKLTI